MAIINCPECGKQISDQSEYCLNCGYPIKNNVNKATTIKRSIPSIKNITIISIVVCIILLAIIGFSSTLKAKKWQENYYSLLSEVLDAAVVSEEAGNMILSVWYNAIYEERDNKTDKYCMNGNRFNDDFNISLGNYLTSLEYSPLKSSIEQSINKVDELMRDLNKPPKKYEEAYNLISQLYDAFYDLTKYALNPIGSYNSYSSDFTSADDNLAKLYKKAIIYRFD